ncbi:MAG: FTR1 family iron permease [Chloroflexi bacterium]|nr:FTR1 family iron permease [Chloroflexota bacterium]
MIAKIRLVAILAFAALLLAPLVALAATPAENLENLAGHLDVAMSKLQSGDVAGSQPEYQAFVQGWPAIEDSIRQQNANQYRAIEGGMANTSAAYATQPPDGQRILTAMKTLDESVDAFISASSPAPSAQAGAGGGPTMASESQLLTQAQQHISAGDATVAAANLKDFISGWPTIETQVAAKDSAGYTRIENEMAQAYGLLTSTPPRTAQAASLVSDMQRTLAPFTQEQVHYGVFDAAIILLREGFEALLVFAALLAFLKRSGNAAKQAWIWAGGGAGLLLSIAIAVVVNIAFAKAGGSSRELLEGVTGLVAAAMLIWMMFWLHGKANVKAWNKYISERSQRAIATNSLFSLAAIAFLAVLREGAETILFYVGIAPGIDTTQLLLGIGVGAAGLLILAVLMLLVGVRIPIRPFFLVTSALVFFLAFKFAGTGVHSLQVAGALSAHTPGYLPTSEFFGVYPTWETAIMQLVILGVTAIGFALTSGDHDAQHAPHAAASKPASLTR